MSGWNAGFQHETGCQWPATRSQYFLDEYDFFIFITRFLNPRVVLGFIAFVNATAIPDNLTAEPEFLRPADVYSRYRIKRGMLYRLIESGKVRSVCLRERGKVRGARLVVHDSLRAYIFSHEVTPGESEA